MKVSFEMPGWKECMKSQELHMGLAERAAEKLKKQYFDIQSY